ncbi:hypothetical protein NDU88_003341 [Pleurodeles waltl]|uniref:Uncharacterized protein n=1 Tax=Pleurodeles waltl TaxID=8319 RepID=A0AAV7VDR1_PLEWA|nr:hypothetical protein NDU88_003341 [Pleurodeles waltl]
MASLSEALPIEGPNPYIYPVGSGDNSAPWAVAAVAIGVRSPEQGGTGLAVEVDYGRGPDIQIESQTLTWEVADRMAPDLLKNRGGAPA